MKTMKEFLKKRKIKILSLTGNKKIVENLYVYAFITILELLNSNWGIKPNSFDIRILLNSDVKPIILKTDDFKTIINQTFFAIIMQRTDLFSRSVLSFYIFF